MCCIIYRSVTPTTIFIFFFFNDTATTEIYTLSLHDALPISIRRAGAGCGILDSHEFPVQPAGHHDGDVAVDLLGDRKSTRLNSSHSQISYAVFCLKKKTKSCSVTPTPSSIWRTMSL